MFRVALVRGTSRGSRLSPWGRLVAISATIVIGGLLTVAAWGLATREQRITSYAVQGSLNRVALDLGDADVTVARAARAATVTVRRDDRVGLRAPHHGRHAALVRRACCGSARAARRPSCTVLGRTTASRCPTTCPST